MAAKDEDIHGGDILTEMHTSIWEHSKIQLGEIVANNRLLDVQVSVFVKTLTPEDTASSKR